VQNLFTELTLGIRSQLLEHFKRFPVNASGGLMVMKDVTRYVELFKSWELDDDLKATGGALDVLLEVGSLFVVGPEALREKLRGGQASGTTGTNGSGSGPTTAAAETTAKGHHGGLSVQEVRAYVLRREDWNSVAMQSVLNTL
jgi:hypothetical protein